MDAAGVSDGKLLAEDEATPGGRYPVVLVDQDADEALSDRLRQDVVRRYGGPDLLRNVGYAWPNTHFERLSPTTQDRWWPLVEGAWNGVVVPASGFHTEFIRLPVDVGGSLVLLHQEGARTVPAGGRLIPPTAAGFAVFLALAEQSDLAWSQLNAAALWWWARPYPRRASQAPAVVAAK